MTVLYSNIQVCLLSVIVADRSQLLACRRLAHSFASSYKQLRCYGRCHFIPSLCLLASNDLVCRIGTLQEGSPDAEACLSVPGG
jgi:hypothetical protein